MTLKGIIDVFHDGLSVIVKNFLVKGIGAETVAPKPFSVQKDYKGLFIGKVEKGGILM